MLRSAACVLLTVSLGSVAWAQGRSISHIPVDDSDRVVLRGNRHPLARPENDIGPMDVRLPLQRMILVLTPGPTVERQMEQFLGEQLDPASPNYHQWLTPEQFQQRFGVPPEQIAAVEDWLKSYGFTIDEVPAGGRAINFSGTVLQVEQAFHVPMRTFLVNGVVHHANAQDPSIPRALAGVVVGPLSLHDFRKQAMHTRPRPLPATYYTSPNYNDPLFGNALAPSDFSTIYDVWRLYARGINGTGQSIAIVARVDIFVSDVQDYRNFFGLPPNDPVFIHNGPAPGVFDPNEETEALLDVEWSGGVARDATIKLVISQSTTSTDGVDLSAQYIVANNVAPIISTSFGACEADLKAENTFWNSTWGQAAAQGQTAFVASGDSGAAGCDLSSASTATHGLGINGLASTPYNVAVGGSQFMDTANPGLYWSATNNAVNGSVLSYIPEQAWNESGGGAGLASTGGGASILYSKPAWQAGPGVPADGKRDIPDVALSAANHDGYEVFQADAFFGLIDPIVVGGTSASTPSFAGLMALVLQKTGSRVGNANPTFYAMANSQYANHGVAAFHDVTVGNNSVPGQTGFNAGRGYDQTTGVGTADAFTLVTQWGQTPSGSPGGSANIVNGNFEAGNLTGWTVGGTLAPAISTVQKHGGSFSALLGASAAPEPNGDSFLSQDIALPASFTSATLTFWYWPASQDNINFDWQEAQIQTTSGSPLAQVMKVCQNTQAWTQVTYDLTPYKGQTIRIYFNAHGDGFGDLTYMYLDDVTLTITP